MKSLLSINHIFGLFTLAGMLLLSLFFGGLMLSGFNEVFDHHVERTMDARLTGFAQQLTDYVSLHDAMLHDLASNPLLVQGVMQQESGKANAVDFLERYRIMGAQRRLTLYGFDGHLLHDTAKQPRRPPLSENLVQILLRGHNKHIWRFQAQDKDQSSLWMAVPISWNAVPEGVLAMEIPSLEMPQLKRHYGQGEEDDIELFKDGERIFGVDGHLNGRQAQLYMPTLGITLRYTAHLGEIYSHRDRLLARIKMIGLAALLLAGSGVFWMGRVLFVRPLQRLKERTTHLANGEVRDLLNEVRRRVMVRELQELTDQFDVMALQVSSARTSLEEKVHERTAQLEWELEERHKTEHRLRQVLTLQTAILDSANSSIISTDRTGIVQTFNKGAERMLGYKAVAVVGQYTLDMFYNSNELRQHSLQLSATLDKRVDPGIESLFVLAREGKVDEREWMILHQDGHQVPVLMTVTPIYNSSGLLVGYLNMGTEISERKRLAAELKETNWRLQRALDSAQAGTFYYAVVHDHMQWNRRALEMFGLNDATFNGHLQDWLQRVVAVDRHRIDTLFAEVLATPNVETLDISYTILRQGDEAQRVIRTQGWIHRDPHGKATHLSGLFLDITEQMQAQQVLEEARQAAEEASQAKSDFLASMSHEIRTPMNAVIGLSDVLAETPLNPEQQHYVTTLQRASHTLLDLINAILDLSKIESGRFELIERPFDLSDMAHGVCSVLRVQAEQKGLSLALEMDETLPPFVVGDSPRLRQILINLIGNAIKFTEQGFVKVSVQARDQQRTLWFGIADSGVGIAPTQVEQIFEKFTQVDSSVVRRFAGSGLGLAISKQLVGLMGGHIGVESRLGEGSLFYFSLPLRPGETLFEAPLRAPIYQESPAESVPIRLLVVEDSVDNRMLVRTYFKKYHCELRFAVDGQEGVEMFQEGGCDLVFMDVQMPRMDGYTATRLIRNWERSHGMQPTPILALTAHALESDVKKSRQAGCNEHLTKPVSKRTLVDAVERQLNIKLMLRSLPAVSLPQTV
ncbi:PAS/PAC sensor hybrid histidine kinase [Magnetococcus marinus MC-1]|uniref:histidine kinase n=1 Tax=Magnetococcus marinus (strain ATCC BAA-1437 / JCM 17883 / MC-1) TaxID=156889 RepID=A0LCN9_MAGMM|nr:ATP-binding protein [Magnetococcus marinus]ABK45732.1 PAS/PAC sensor hybrid histidine kinase [Magnetococcus marinus MC-1]